MITNALGRRVSWRVILLVIVGFEIARGSFGLQTLIGREGIHKRNPDNDNSLSGSEISTVKTYER